MFVKDFSVSDFKCFEIQLEHLIQTWFFWLPNDCLEIVVKLKHLKGFWMLADKVVVRFLYCFAQREGGEYLFTNGCKGYARIIDLEKIAV